jgi:plastocyanin
MKKAFNVHHLAIVLVALAAGAAGGVATTESNPVIDFACCEYAPRDITIDQGATVDWNGDFNEHPLVSDENLWPTVGSGDAFSHTFDATGVYQFHCAIHGDAFGMSGVVRVLKVGETGISRPPHVTSVGITSTSLSQILAQRKIKMCVGLGTPGTRKIAVKIWSTRAKRLVPLGYSTSAVSDPSDCAASLRLRPAAGRLLAQLKSARLHIRVTTVDAMGNRGDSIFFRHVS